MIMPRGQQLLLPVNPLFIVVTLLLPQGLVGLWKTAWKTLRGAQGARV